MTNEVALFADAKTDNLPAHLKDSDSAVTANLTGGGGNTKRISIKGSVFRMMVGDQEVAKNEERTMNMIIVASAPTWARTYYESTFVEGESATPVCWSDDGNAPSATCSGAQSTLCATCPQNVKGSGTNDSKACRYSARVAVILENDTEGAVYAVSIPAQSIFGEAVEDYLPLQEYAKLLGARGFSIDRVVTKFKFDTNSATPKLVFRASRPITDAELTTVKAHADTPETLDLVAPREFTSNAEKEFDKQPKSKAADGGPSTFEDAPEVQETKPADDGIAEPTKAKSEPAPTDANEDDLADILDEWD